MIFVGSLPFYLKNNIKIPFESFNLSKFAPFCLIRHNLYSLLCCSVYLRRNFDTQFKFYITENLNLSIQPNPSYNYAYQVSDDESQTYIAHQEGREDNVVTGEYSYVDPFGALITVTYIADSNGYREERKSQPNFVQIRALPATAARVIPEPAPVRRVVVPKPAPKPIVQAVKKVVKAETGSDDSDLVARIISQLTPFIRNTVSTSLSSGAPAPAAPAPKPAPVRRVVPARPAPIVREVVNVEEQVAGIFGTG